MGDLNARVGRDEKSWSGVIGKQGEETLNRNGHRLLDSCALHELVILNTIFQHKEIHKFTWESKGRGLRSIIDYFIVRRALRPGVVDVRVVGDTELESDHHLVLLKVRLEGKEAKEVYRGREMQLRVHKLESREARIRFE